MKFEQDDHWEEKQHGGKDGEGDSEEDIETEGRDQEDPFLSGGDLLLVGAENGLSSKHGVSIDVYLISC